MILIDFHFWRKTSGSGFKITYTWLEQFFYDKPSFRKNYKSFISLDFKCKKWCFVVGLSINWGQWTKNLRCFGKKRFGSFIETAFYVLPTKVWRKNCNSKTTQCFIFLGFSAENFLVMDETFSVALSKLHSTCRANVLIKLDILNVLLQLSGLERKEVGILVESFPQDCRNYIILYVSRRYFWEEVYFKEEKISQSCFWI